MNVEEPQFLLDRGYFKLRLVLEHHVLRRMDDGGRCVMSKMEPARARARDTGCRDSHSLVFSIQTCVFLGQEPNLAPEISKSDKIDCQKPRAELRTKELGSPNLDKSSQAMPIPGASTKNETGVFLVNGVLLKARRGRFVEDSSTEIEKTKVFN